MSKPLAIDLFCGLGGWTEGLLAEGYDVIGFDIERHVYGEHKYPAQLVIQDVLTLHGSQFRTADLIVASPPCQEFSYMAMPWSKAKAKAAAIRADKTGAALERLNRLFNACFRIQREASEAAGRHIPMVVENVRGAIPWVGRSRWNFGSFHLWGDVPALMPPVFRGGARLKTRDGEQWNVNRANYTGTLGWRDETGIKVPGVDWHNYGKPGYTKPSFRDGLKNAGGSWFNIGSPGQKELGRNPVHELTREGVKSPGLDWSGYGKPGHKAQGFNVVNAQRVRAAEGRKNGNDWLGSGENCSAQRRASSKSDSRKFASAMIAKIPLPLSRHIAATFKPMSQAT